MRERGLHLLQLLAVWPSGWRPPPSLLLRAGGLRAYVRVGVRASERAGKQASKQALALILILVSVPILGKRLTQ